MLTQTLPPLATYGISRIFGDSLSILSYRVSPAEPLYSRRRNLPSDNPYDRNKPYKYYLLSERSFMYALYGHQFSRAFGRYVMAILALVFTLTSFVCSANGDVPRANYQSVQNPQSNDQMYFAETDDGASVESPSSSAP